MYFCILIVFFFFFFFPLIYNSSGIRAIGGVGLFLFTTSETCMLVHFVKLCLCSVLIKEDAAFKCLVLGEGLYIYTPIKIIVSKMLTNSSILQ